MFIIFSHLSKFTQLWNHLTRQNPAEIFKILHRMKPRRLMRFLKFMKHSFLHDQTIQYNEDCFTYFQDVLICCPTDSFTKFLCSIDKQCVVNLLERRLDIWTRFFTGFLNSNIIVWLNYLMAVYNDLDFISDLISEFVNQASMNDLALEIRQNIFNFVRRNPSMALLFLERRHHAEQSRTVEDDIRRMNEWLGLFAEQCGLEPVPEWTIADIGNNEDDLQIELPPPHHSVNAGAFVCQTFPSLHPLAQNEKYVCGICRCGPDEPNDDGIHPVFRSMPCCPQQMACHGCLVMCATLCNTPDHQNEFKNTSIFVCPYCRAETGFFPDEN